MSSWATCRIECALCHQANTCSFLKSTNTFGGVNDLDTRHGGAARSDLLGAIQRCSHCGYCAPDIRRTHEKAAEIVPTARYRQVVEDRSGSAIYDICVNMYKRRGKLARNIWRP